MKKWISIVPVCALAACFLGACVDDNPTVILHGLAKGASCEATSTDQTYIYGAYCMPTDAMYVNGSLHIMNYASTGDTWASSGSTSSGTTFDPTIPNVNAVFVDEIVFKCKTIDGDPKACENVDSIRSRVNTMVSAGGGVCISMPAVDLSSWGGSSLDVEIFVNYHDASGYMTGSSSRFLFKIINTAIVCDDKTNPFIDHDDDDEDEEDNSGDGDNSGMTIPRKRNNP